MVLSVNNFRMRLITHAASFGRAALTLRHGSDIFISRYFMYCCFSMYLRSPQEMSHVGDNQMSGNERRGMFIRYFYSDIIEILQAIYMLRSLHIFFLNMFYIF